MLIVLKLVQFSPLEFLFDRKNNQGANKLITPFHKTFFFLIPHIHLSTKEQDDLIFQKHRITQITCVKIYYQEPNHTH